MTVEKGLFNVYLGTVTPLDPVQFIVDEMYLGITVGTDDEMTPRLRLASAPFAFTAEQSYCTITIWYQDLDHDNYGNAAATAEACTAPADYVVNGTDCNDQAQSIHPDAPEVCNGLDENCDTDRG